MRNRQTSTSSAAGVLFLILGFFAGSAAFAVYVAGWSSLVWFGISTFALWFAGWSLSVPTLHDRYPESESDAPETTEHDAPSGHASHA